MTFVKQYMLFSYKLFGKYIPPYEKTFTDLAGDLDRVRINAILPEYISTIIVSSLLCFFIALPAFHTILFLFLGKAIPLLAVALITIFAAVTFGGMVFILLYSYPKFLLSEYSRSIDAALPYAAAHMSTIAGTGTPALSIFKVLANFKEFGELSNECGDIVRDVELLWFDFLTAVERTARRTASVKFRDLLWGLITTIRSGGDLRLYLIQKADTMLEEHRRTIREFVNTVGMFSEIYTTIFIAAPLLVIIMVATMAILGGKSLPINPATMMVLLIYVFIPFGSILSILALKGMKPQEV